MSDRIQQLKNEIQNCDYYVLSHPRSGRTWLRYFIGHYISKYYNTKMTHRFTSRHNGSPLISFRHDYMSLMGSVSWEKYFQLQNLKNFIFEEQIKSKPILYLVRDPISVLTSHYHYLNSGFIKNFDRKFKTIKEFAMDEKLGYERLLDFVLRMLKHYLKNKNKKCLIQYEKLKQEKTEWTKVIEFFGWEYKKDFFEIALKETDFSKMSNSESGKEVDQRMTRRGQLTYINNYDEVTLDLLVNNDKYKEYKKCVESTE
jgi:hypothetical protein